MKRKTIIKILKYSIIILIFFFIIKFLYANINTINISELHFNYLFLALSVLIYLTHVLTNAAIWHLITRQNACNIGFLESMKVRIYSDFGKYIPGKVFAYGLLFYSYNQKGISKKKIMVCSFQELIIGTLAAIIIALVSMYFVNIEALNEYKLIFLALGTACLVVIHPGILKYFVNHALKFFKREPVVLKSTYGQTLFLLALYFLNWLVFGLGFYFFINSFYTYPLSYYFFTTGAFAIAGIIGFAALFAPAGLGVREGVLVFILTKIFPSAVAAIISLISRVWMTFCELLLLLLFFIVFYFKDRKKK